MEHALSVSINKLGDLKYMRDDLPGARACYEEALQLRISGLEKQGAGEALQERSTTQVSNWTSVQGRGHEQALEQPCSKAFLAWDSVAQGRCTSVIHDAGRRQDIKARPKACVGYEEPLQLRM